MSGNTPYRQPLNSPADGRATPEEDDHELSDEEEAERFERLLGDLEEHIRNLPQSAEDLRHVEEAVLVNPDGSIPPLAEQLVRLTDAHVQRERVSGALLTRAAARLGYDREQLDLFYETSRVMDRHFAALDEERRRVRALAREQANRFGTIERRQMLQYMQAQRQAQDIRGLQTSLQVQQAQQAQQMLITQQAFQQTVCLQQTEQARRVHQQQQQLPEPIQPDHTQQLFQNLQLRDPPQAPQGQETPQLQYFGFTLPAGQGQQPQQFQPSPQPSQTSQLLSPQVPQSQQFQSSPQSSQASQTPQLQQLQVPQPLPSPFQQHLQTPQLDLMGQQLPQFQLSPQLQQTPQQLPQQLQSPQLAPTVQQMFHPQLSPQPQQLQLPQQTPQQLPQPQEIQRLQQLQQLQQQQRQQQSSGLGTRSRDSSSGGV